MCVHRLSSLLLEKIRQADARPSPQVVETRLGALLLAKFLGLPYTLESRPFPSYKTIVDAYFQHRGPTHGPIRSNSQRPEKLVPEGATVPALPSSRLPPRTAGGAHELRTMIGLIGQALGGPGLENGMTMAQVAQKLEVGEDVLEHAVTDREVEPQEGRYKIWTRARHVVRLSSLSISSSSSSSSGSERALTRLSSSPAVLRGPACVRVQGHPVRHGGNLAARDA